MGIQINGNTNNINAGIGSLSIEDINELDIVGVATAANFKTGVSNLHSVGLSLSGGQIDVGSNIKIGNAGVITATTFSGSGASLTSIPAGQLTGTVADARISTLTASKLSGALPAISGANLTNLDASDLASGTIPDARFPATLPALDGSNLTGISAGTSLSGSTNNTVCTVTGANAIQGEANLTFSGSTLKVNSTTGHSYLKLNSNDSYSGAIHFGDQSDDDAAQIWYDNYQGNGMYLRTSENTPMSFYTNGTQRLRIASGGDIQVENGNLHIDNSGELAVFETDTNLGFTNSAKLCFDFSSNVARIRTSGNGSFTTRPLAFYTGNTEIVRITSDGRIGINKTNPNNYELDIWSRSTSDDAQIRLHNSGTGGSQHTLLRFSLAGTTASNYIYFGDGDDSNVGQIRYNHGSNYMSFHTNATEQMRIHSTGAVTKPNNPIFFAYMDAQTNHSSGDTLKLDHTEINVGSGYNTSNKRFTPPVNGYYMFHGSANIMMSNGEFTRSASVRLRKNGTSLTYQLGRNSLTGYQASYPQVDGTFMVYGTTSDYFECRVEWETGGGNHSNLNTTETLHPHGTKFMGYLIG